VIVFTNGCFDVLHRGHLSLLRGARALGDRLIVGLNGDASVRRLKGSGRPVNPVRDRAELLRAIRWVDEVIIFDEDTPAELLAWLADQGQTPGLVVKGDDYRAEAVITAPGARVVILPREPGLSSSAAIAAIRGVGP
jgi:D-beta-D-heptose 7-phosphate kinase/D-beta-D-heptose 1-phosphate adenosyltransferase